MPRSYTLGLAIGSFWLITAAVGFSGTVLALMKRPAATFALAPVLVAGVAALAVAVLAIRAAARLPKNTAPGMSGSRIWLWFVAVFAAEIVMFIVVAVVCGGLRRFEYIIPLDLVVVGVHFLPLAWLFRVPRYYTLGVGFCVIPLAAVLLVDPTARSGALLTLTVLPTFGCSLVSAAIGLLGLRESWGLARSGVPA